MKYKIVVCIFGHIGKIEEYMQLSHLNHVTVFGNHLKKSQFEKSEASDVYIEKYINFRAQNQHYNLLMKRPFLVRHSW